jgi:hypothetical protein
MPPKGRAQVVWTKVMMASTRFGCGVVTYKPSEELFSFKVHCRAFQLGGTESKGADITPGCPDPKNEAQWRFSLIDLRWKKTVSARGKPCSLRDDPQELDKMYSKTQVADEFFGMNGTETSFS